MNNTIKQELDIFCSNFIEAKGWDSLPDTNMNMSLNAQLSVMDMIPITPLVTKKSSASLYSSYLNVLDPEIFQHKVHKVANEISKLHKKLKFSHIAFCGNSGASLAYPVSFLTSIPLVLVRKERERCHGETVEGFGELKSYLIIDDFIASGETVRYIVNAIDKFSKSVKIKCRGVLTYNMTEDYKETHFFKNKKIDDIKIYAPSILYTL